MANPFTTPADAAFALLGEAHAGRVRMTRKAASFAGQTVVDPTPLTEAQQGWLSTLRAGLPSIDGEAR